MNGGNVGTLSLNLHTRLVFHVYVYVARNENNVYVRTCVYET